jgi:hypothetical protein
VSQQIKGALPGTVTWPDQLVLEVWWIWIWVTEQFQSDCGNAVGYPVLDWKEDTCLSVSVNILHVDGNCLCILCCDAWWLLLSWRLQPHNCQPFWHHPGDTYFLSTEVSVLTGMHIGTAVHGWVCCSYPVLDWKEDTCLAVSVNILHVDRNCRCILCCDAWWLLLSRLSAFLAPSRGHFLSAEVSVLTERHRGTVVHGCGPIECCELLATSVGVKVGFPTALLL